MSDAPQTSPPKPPFSMMVIVRLSVMMFLQFAIWGAWLPLLWPYLSGHLKFEPGQIGDIFAVGAVGAIIGPFCAGQIADRWLNTEKFLGISHLLGGILVFQLSWIDGYYEFLYFSFIYSLIYSPTIALTNSLSFHHLSNRDRQFGFVRLFGTLGWIVVGIGIGQWILYTATPGGEGVTEAQIQTAQTAAMSNAFVLSGILGVVMGIYCFTLPRTPPTKGKQEFATWEAIKEIRMAPLVTLFLLAVPISCIHQFYFVHTSGFIGEFQRQSDSSGLAWFFGKVFGVGGGGMMTIGQITELGVLALIPLFAKVISRKWFLLIGTAAYFGRMLLFVLASDLGLDQGDPVLVLLIAGIGLHGLCFGCFIFVAFMIVDEETSHDVRASAQNLFNLVIIGIGIIVGSYIASGVAVWASIGGQMDYAKLFTVPMYAAAACFLMLLMFYPSHKETERMHALRGDF